ncbi:unnamed protein product [Gongylonema pulchrum]|uniref:Secreted protein n=1 Tax=Gongylonema pulchrum TaxID=637853 RepID=A0A183DNX1_9BILA|nr:unnamed protein product [Gongylonema pulchrum]
MLRRQEQVQTHKKRTRRRSSSANWFIAFVFVVSILCKFRALFATAISARSDEHNRVTLRHFFLHSERTAPREYSSNPKKRLYCATIISCPDSRLGRLRPEADSQQEFELKVTRRSGATQ